MTDQGYISFERLYGGELIHGRAYRTVLFDGVCKPSHYPLLDFGIVFDVAFLALKPRLVQLELWNKCILRVFGNRRTFLPAIIIRPSHFPDQVRYLDDDDGRQKQHKHRQKDHSRTDKDIVAGHRLIDVGEVSMVMAVTRACGDRDGEVRTAVDKVAVWAASVVMAVSVDVILEGIFVSQAVEDTIFLALFGLCVVCFCSGTPDIV
jgi:hypothetical protein